MITSHIIAFILMSLLICFFLGLGIWSNILRDDIDDPVAFQASAPNTPINKIPRPFSLARTQFATWTTIIACSYVYLYFYLGCNMMALNKTALILMGISGATTAAGSIIDKNQSQASATDPTAPVRHQNSGSNGIFSDILSDGDGINIHRFQNVSWTIINMVIYIYLICQTQNSPGCGLPNLDETLLGISGISNAAYVGLKINENK